MKSLLSVLTLIFMVTFAVSCNNSPKGDAEAKVEQAVDKSGKEYTSNYICPMHCKDSGSDSAGECPVCGMDYVANKDKGHSHDGHDHGDHDHDHGDHSHDGHNH